MRAQYVGYVPHTRPGELDIALANCNAAIDELEYLGLGFDSILVCGLSGIIPGAIISYQRNKQLVVIRKPNDQNHGISIEGAVGWSRGPYIILDDFIESGNTMTHILSKTPEGNPPRGVVLYCREADGARLLTFRRNYKPRSLREAYLFGASKWLLTYTEKEVSA